MANNNKQKIRVWWDEKLKLGRFSGNIKYMDEKLASEIIKKENELMEEHGKINWIIDLSGTEKYSSKARKMFSDAVKNTEIIRMAMIGASVFVRVVVNFILARSGVKNAKHFETEEEALEWLK